MSANGIVDIRSPSDRGQINGNRTATKKKTYAEEAVKTFQQTFYKMSSRAYLTRKSPKRNVSGGSDEEICEREEPFCARYGLPSPFSLGGACSQPLDTLCAEDHDSHHQWPCYLENEFTVKVAILYQAGYRKSLSMQNWFVS